MRRTFQFGASITAMKAAHSAFNVAQCDSKNPPVYDIAVIGAGVVGCSVARECATKYKASVVVIEKEDCIAAGISSGNSGLGVTGYDAPVGTMERKLLRDSIRIHQRLYRSFGLSHEHVRKSGSLVVAWTPEELAELKQVLADNKECGDDEVVILSQDELRLQEPSLSHEALGAVFLPHEAIVEPWVIPVAHAESALVHGVKFELSRRVLSAVQNKETGLWNINTEVSEDAALGRSTNGKLLTEYRPKRAPSAKPAQQAIQARVVINCAGLHGDTIEKMRLDSGGIPRQEKDFTIYPRKGQFVVYEQLPASEVPNSIVEKVANQFTKGVMLWRTVYGNVIVGPTAVEVESKEDRSTDEATVRELRAYAESVVPRLKTAKVVGTYGCMRPATQYRDFQIEAHPSQRWITVGGIRSTGLTASSGIGAHVAQLYADVRAGKAVPPTDCSEDKMMRVTDAANNPLSAPSAPLKPFPTLAQLSADYRASLPKGGESNGVGRVTINGHQYRVTHPISSFGMESYGKK